MAVTFVHVYMLLIVQQFDSSSVMSLPPGIVMAGGDGLHGDEAGRKRELRLLKNKSVKIQLCSLICYHLTCCVLFILQYFTNFMLGFM